MVANDSPKCAKQVKINQVKITRFVYCKVNCFNAFRSPTRVKLMKKNNSLFYSPAF